MGPLIAGAVDGRPEGPFFVAFLICVMLVPALLLAGLTVALWLVAGRLARPGRHPGRQE